MMCHYNLSCLLQLVLSQVNENVVRYAKYIFEPVDSTTGNWQLAHEDNDMKVRYVTQ